MTRRKLFLLDNYAHELTAVGRKYIGTEQVPPDQMPACERGGYETSEVTKEPFASDDFQERKT